MRNGLFKGKYACSISTVAHDTSDANERQVRVMAVKQKTPPKNNRSHASSKTKPTKPTDRAFPVDGFARAREAAEFLAVSVRTVYRMIEGNEIANAPLRDGEAVRIPWKALHQLMDEAMKRQSAKN